MAPYLREPTRPVARRSSAPGCYNISRPHGRNRAEALDRPLGSESWRFESSRNRSRARVPTLLAVAKATERLGFDGFFRSDHVPEDGLGQRPARRDRCVDHAGRAGAGDQQIRLGTLVTPVTFRHPGCSRSRAAQVDQMTGGRVEVGLGAGWYDEEHTAFGDPVPPVNEATTCSRSSSRSSRPWATPAGETFAFKGRTCQVASGRHRRCPQRGRIRRSCWAAGRARARPRLAVTYADEYNAAFSRAETT